MKLLIVSLVVLAAGSCNVGESRGAPRTGQVTNSQYSQTFITVHRQDTSETLTPGQASAKNRYYTQVCVPAGYTGTATIQTDKNPAGFPPTRIHGGSCHDLTADAVAAVTVSR